MKKSVIVVLLLVLFSLGNAMSKENNISDKNINNLKNKNNSDIYIYPITPGTKEWKNLRNHSDKIKVSQIPENLIGTMSTNGLLETVLNYPLLGDIIAFSNYQIGYNVVSRNFRGLQELSKRKDLTKIIIKKYYELNNTNIPQNKYQRIKLFEKIVGIEMIISQDFVIENLDFEQKLFLLKEAIKRYEKINDELGYSTPWQESIFYIIDKILLSLNYQPYKSLLTKNKEIKSNIKNYGYNIENIREILIKQAKKFILQNKGVHYEK